LKKACALLSGGKDSNYALWRGIKDGFEIACIATVIPRKRDSWMFHYPVMRSVRLQVSLMDMSDRFYEIEVSGEKEREVEELLKGLSEISEEVNFNYIIVGGIASNYQKKRFEKIAKALNARLYSPQWGEDPSGYLLKLIKSDFEFIITEAKVYGLTKEFVGRVVDEKLAMKIISRSKKYGFNAAFEGGEAETLVLYQPLFGDKRLCVEGYRKSLSEFEHVFDIRNVWIGSRFENCVKVIDES